MYKKFSHSPVRRNIFGLPNKFKFSSSIDCVGVGNDFRFFKNCRMWKISKLLINQSGAVKKTLKYDQRQRSFVQYVLSVNRSGERRCSDLIRVKQPKQLCKAKSRLVSASSARLSELFPRKTQFTYGTNENKTFSLLFTCEYSLLCFVYFFKKKKIDSLVFPQTLPVISWSCWTACPLTTSEIAQYFSSWYSSQLAQQNPFFLFLSHFSFCAVAFSLSRWKFDTSWNLLSCWFLT